MSDYRFWSGLEYLDLPREQQAWLVEPLLSPGALMLIYGAPKAGKSRFGLGLAIAIATGQELWLDKYPIHQPGPVLWLEADNSPAEWLQVLRDVVEEGHDISNIHFADRDWIPYPFDLLDENAAHDEVLRDMIQAHLDAGWPPPVLVVIDTIREAHSGDENDSTAIRNVITRLQAATYPAALLLIAHSRKGGGLQAMGGDNDDDNGRVMEENRGSNYLVGKMQTVARVTTTRQRTHGYFTAEGRSIGQERLRMKQHAPSYLWHPDVDPSQELVRTLAENNPDWSERRIARELAQIMKLEEEKARSLVRRTLKASRSAIFSGHKS